MALRRLGARGPPGAPREWRQGRCKGCHRAECGQGRTHGGDKAWCAGRHGRKRFGAARRPGTRLASPFHSVGKVPARSHVVSSESRTRGTDFQLHVLFMKTNKKKTPDFILVEKEVVRNEAAQPRARNAPRQIWKGRENTLKILKVITRCQMNVLEIAPRFSTHWD